jgi:hypothetical protein
MAAKSVTGWQPSKLFLSVSIVSSCKFMRSMKRADRSVRFGSDVKEFVGEYCDVELSVYIATTRSNRKGARQFSAN